MPTLLYYPLVRPPVEIIHQALLYWDEISSIVPEDPEIYEIAVSDELKQLKDQGLYHPITIGIDLARPRSYQYQLEALLRELQELATAAPRSQFSPADSLFFRSKMGYPLEEMIVNLGLGRRLAESAYPGSRIRSLAVSQEVQLLLVGALARELACTETKRAYTPYTDQQSADETSLRVLHPGTGIRAWRVELGRLLPTPAPGTPTSKVLAFREKYADERQRLVGATQAMLGDLSRDWDHPADILRRMEIELKEAREDYQSAAQSSRLAWTTRSISGTVAVATAVMGALAFPDLDWIAAIAGSIGFNIATREIRPVSEKRNNHPFSYLHHVERELA